MNFDELKELNEKSWVMSIKAFKRNNKRKFEPYSIKRIREFSSLVGKPNSITKAQVMITSYTPPKSEQWRKNPVFERELVELIKEKEEKVQWLHHFFRYLLMNIELLKNIVNRKDVQLLKLILKLEGMFIESILSNLTNLDMNMSFKGGK
ncbi:MAG: hypothetical protein ACTSSG_11190 [Candidatus Heimdallarchaeaceae archaeon]